ncbi:ATP-binding protein [Actinosynnema sp. ALI-1.44]|uniref:ATP-binding protein n=1 Tax=Actinosynnema sp. ALI-1.44 TaxID=1933779 RepID=UPI00143DDE29|nr:LuxR C-terminal-related transcriptional regulator [Actinosynnema sp. ALI-1.44]
MTSFVGRQAEVDQVRRRLAASRLVTLIGPGGAGKTRLATRVAQDHPDEFRFVALDSLRDPGLLAQTVAAELGLRDVPDEPTSRVVDFLKDKSLLLVLDNCEHMVRACGTLVGEILEAAPDVRILATSRHVLGVGGEQLLPVNPLPVPQVRNGKLVGDTDAVTLFADRASAAAPRFQVDADNQETVVKICQRLDGMPLAIELAVVWLRVLSLNELLTNIDDRFRLLSRGEQTKPERHQTLTATVEWSYELCSPEERQLWARLSVFDGGFTLAAAAEVCDIDRFEILTLIADLVDKSVLIRTGDQDIARYRMLDTIRQYGVERLHQSGHLAEFRARHSRYFMEFGRGLAAEWFGHRQLELVAQTRREHANIRSALESGLTDGDGLTGARLAVSLHFYWLNCGFFGEGRRWLDRVLKLDLPADLRVQALAVNAYATAGLGEGHTAVHMGQQGVDLARTLDNDELLWLALYCRATSALVTGDYPSAEKCYAEAIDCYDRVPDPGARMFPPYAARGMTAAFCLDGRRALELGERAIKFSVPHGELWARAYAHYALAMAKWLLGDLPACLREAAESIQLHLRFNDLSGFVMVAEVLAAIALGNQENERAAAILGVVERVWSEVGGSLLADSKPWLEPHQACAAQLRQVMGEQRYAEAFAVGTANGASLAAASAYVLSGHDRGSPLTKREQQVADLVAQGATNKEIAVRLDISRRTAEVHVDHILRKLRFASRSQIAAWVAAGSSQSVGTH